MTKPPVNPKINLEDFIRERDAAIATGDLLEMARFYQKHNPGFDNPELKQEARRKKENKHGQEAQVLTPDGADSNQNDPASQEPEQPAMDVSAVAGSSSETPTG